jgi:hypothetical protein
MARILPPRSEYLHTRDWLWAAVEARLRLPWLPPAVRMVRSALVISCIAAGAVAAVAATLVSALAGVAFWSAFAVVFGIVLGWAGWTWMRFWRVVRRGNLSMERRMAELRAANWRLR